MRMNLNWPSSDDTEAFRSAVVVDGTGGGDVAYHGGCDMDEERRFWRGESSAQGMRSHDLSTATTCGSRGRISWGVRAAAL